MSNERFVASDGAMIWITQIEQIARLMPAARFELIEGAEHVIWFSHHDELRVLLREFVTTLESNSSNRAWTHRREK